VDDNMANDSQVIYGNTSANKSHFTLDGYTYFMTKNGIAKKVETGRRMKDAVVISQKQYDELWNKYYDLFYR
jgi:hypothetical protein